MSKTTQIKLILTKFLLQLCGSSLKAFCLTEKVQAKVEIIIPYPVLF